MKRIPAGRVMIRVDRYDDDPVITKNIRDVMIMRGNEDRQKFPFAVIGVSPQSILLIPRHKAGAEIRLYTSEDYWVKVFYEEADARLFVEQEGLKTIGEEDAGSTIITVDGKLDEFLRDKRPYEDYRRDVLNSYRRPGDDCRFPPVKLLAVVRRWADSVCPAEVRGVDAHVVLWESFVKKLALENFARQRIEILPIAWRKPFFSLGQAKRYVQGAGTGAHFVGSCGSYRQYWDIYETLLIDEEHGYIVVHDKRLEPD